VRKKGKKVELVTTSRSSRRRELRKRGRDNSTYEKEGGKSHLYAANARCEDGRGVQILGVS